MHIEEEADLDAAALVKAATKLEKAEAKYRYTHDLLGSGHIKTGQTWDKMRRAGDYVRNLLKNTQNQTPKAKTPTSNEWLPIEAYKGGKIERWHKQYDCIFTVRLMSDSDKLFFGRDHKEWLEVTYANTWPEEAFDPYFRQASNPPKK